MAAQINPGIIYMTASLVLFAVAVVLHFHSLHLSLPIPAAVTILTVILPIAAFLNAFVYPNLLRDSSSSSSATSDASDTTYAWQRLLPGTFQGLQAILTAVLATLLAQGFVPSVASRACALDAAWDALYKARDADAVRLVQDTLGCCGYSAVDDRAFPFASLIQQTCAEIYGRDRPCAAAWRAAMATHSGIAFGIVMAVALMQILGLVLMRPGTSWWTALRTPEDEEADGSCDERSRLLGGERGSQQATTSSPVPGPSTYAEAAR